MTQRKKKKKIPNGVALTLGNSLHPSMSNKEWKNPELLNWWKLIETSRVICPNTESTTVREDEKLLILLFTNKKHVKFKIIIIIITELTHSKTILENTAEIKPQLIAIDFKNLPQYSSRSK